MTTPHATHQLATNPATMCVGHASAAAFWLSDHWPEQPSWAPVAEPVLLPSPSDARQAAAQVDARLIMPPGVRGVRTHVLADGKAHNSLDDVVVLHNWQSSLPAGSFVRLAPGLYMATPALTVVMAAQYLSVPEVAELITALYARYCIGADGRQARRATPVLTPDELERYLDSLDPSTPGLKKARQAMKLARVGAESPKEAAISVVMVTSQPLGGGGLDKLELNRAFVVDGRSRAFISTRTVRFDGCVPTGSYSRQKATVAYDFDSVTYHARGYSALGSGAPGEKDGLLDERDYINHDSRRRSGADEMGVDLVTLTTDDVADPRQFFAKVDQLRRKCGLTGLRPTREAWLRRRRLHDTMLSSLRFMLRLEERFERAIQVSSHKRSVGRAAATKVRPKLCRARILVCEFWSRDVAA